MDKDLQILSIHGSELNILKSTFVLRTFMMVAFGILLCTPSIFANTNKFVEVKAKPGDGIIKMLKKYDLYAYTCNLSRFYEINNLKKNAHLIAGKKYKLPVNVYQYNDKSIRSTIGIDDWDLASSIAQYNRDMVAKGFIRKYYLESKELWVPHHILNCNNSKRTEASSSKPVKAEKSFYVSLFGEEHGHISKSSEQLKGKVFYLVSGHGGPDPGAIGNCGGYNLCEDEYAYDVTLRLARNLMEQGATVQVVIQDENDGIRDGANLECDKDETCMGKAKIPLNQLARLRQRTDAINTMYKQYKKVGIKEQYVVVIHVDSRKPHKRQDVFFYHFSKSKTGKRMAYNLHDTFKKKYKIHRANGQYHGTVSTRNLYMLKNTNPPAVYVELANIRNSTDQKRITKVGNREALADWLYEGLIK